MQVDPLEAYKDAVESDMIDRAESRAHKKALDGGEHQGLVGGTEESPVDKAVTCQTSKEVDHHDRTNQDK